MRTINKIEKLDKLSPLALTMVIFSIFSAFYYLAYLLVIGETGNNLLYLFFILIEFYVVITSVFAWWTIIFHDKDTKKNSFELVKSYNLEKFKDKKIAVLIPCYTEPLEIIEKVVRAAKEIKFPHEVYIGDDGKREELKELANGLGVNYVVRPDNSFFKSGNVDYMIRSIKDLDFIAIFDADHIPSPKFLHETLPYFVDKEVAFVQTPQYYTNVNNIISKGASGSQSIFYELILPGKNSFNSAFCVGTNVIFRKTALDDVFEGGFHLAVHSEDIWASLILHENGWKSVYLPKVLAKGLAPDNIQTYFKQQERWARGGFEIFLKSNPLFSTNLTSEQKLQYFFSTAHYFSGFVVLAYFLFPIVYLFTGEAPLANTADLTWLFHYLPFFTSKFLLLFYLVEKFDFALIASSLALFPVYIKAFFKELTNFDYKWITTNTKINREDNVFDYIYWHVAIVFLTLVAIGVGLLTIDNYFDLLIFIFWSLINCGILIYFIANAIQIDRNRS
jgi:cellulose synthase (UDP-forming)